MLKETIIISNKLGLHARASAKLVNTAKRFESEVTLNKDQKTVNAKSIMGVMMLAAGKDSELVIVSEGPDEEDALNAVIELIDQKFGEAE
jgi:phosphocarrier protein HPr